MQEPLRKTIGHAMAVGDALTPMPLFLETDRYVAVPLEETYQTAWRGVPERWRAELVPT